jgi:hypothetical protein
VDPKLEALKIGTPCSERRWILDCILRFMHAKNHFSATRSVCAPFPRPAFPPDEAVPLEIEQSLNSWCY